jgi:hypothetical protein
LNKGPTEARSGYRRYVRASCCVGSIGQLADLMIDGFAKMQPTVTALGEREKIAV